LEISWLVRNNLRRTALPHAPAVLGGEVQAGLSDQVPDGFKFAFKVTDDITIKKFPNIRRCGAKAGMQTCSPWVYNPFV
jgi:hypothetical protein